MSDYYYQEAPPRRTRRQRVGQRIAVFLALLGVLVVVVFAVVVYQRLNDQSMALLTGGLFVLVIFVVIFVIVGFFAYIVWRVSRERRRDCRPPVQTQPIVLSLPQQNQNAYPYGPAPYPPYNPQRRAWRMLEDGNGGVSDG